MKDIREIYKIEKKVIGHQYKVVPEQPMGKQLQVGLMRSAKDTRGIVEISL